ncbi:MAG: HAD-IA family hydrolase [Nitrospirae bacterium]|nr:HAD-IA family hydrolase [Nitrospirota bacterium]
MNLIGLDLDGTLEDSRADMTAVVHCMRAGFSLPARTDETVRPWVNKGMDRLYRACFDDYIQENDARLGEVRKRYEADYLDNVAVKTRLYPEIAAALERLVDLGRLAVITNKPERISRRLLEVLGVDKFIGAVIGSDTCSKTKPDPMVLEEAASRCGFNKANGRALMIGDTEADMKLGRAFGATTIWAAWGYMEQIDAEPDFTAKTPAELPTIVRSALARNP